MLQRCWNTTNQSTWVAGHSEKHFEYLLWHFTLLWPLFGALPRSTTYCSRGYRI